MPVAIPTWRNVEFVPDAIPARDGGTTAIAVDARAGFVTPTPAPMRMNPGSNAVQLEVTVMLRSRRRPIAQSVSPPASRKRTGTRAVSVADAAAHTNESTV